jgi:hypothetical protein
LIMRKVPFIGCYVPGTKPGGVSNSPRPPIRAPGTTTCTAVTAFYRWKNQGHGGCRTPPRLGNWQTQSGYTDTEVWPLLTGLLANASQKGCLTQLRVYQSKFAIHTLFYSQREVSEMGLCKVMLLLMSLLWLPAAF